MHSSSISPWQVCYSTFPKQRIRSQHLPLSHFRTIPANCQTHFRNDYSHALSETNSCCSDQERRKKKSDSYPYQKRVLLEELLYFSKDDTNSINPIHKRRIEEGEEENEGNAKEIEIFSSNMWWADLKAALGQRINLDGIVSSVSVFARDRHLALPHVAVPDIRYIDWAALKRNEFQGVVFDKDNTITVPYSLSLWPPLDSSMRECKSVFGNDIAVFSNSAGLFEFDTDGRKARALESAIGIKVVRHRGKKPAGTAEEIEKHFGCVSSRLIMVGDRPFTDIVYGNRNGFLTILTEPLSLAEEPFIVKQVRKLEIALVNLWSKRGLKPMSHALLRDVVQCVKDSPAL